MGSQVKKQNVNVLKNFMDEVDKPKPSDSFSVGKLLKEHPSLLEPLPSIPLQTKPQVNVSRPITLENITKVLEWFEEENLMTVDEISSAMNFLEYSHKICTKFSTNSNVAHKYKSFIEMNTLLLLRWIWVILSKYSKIHVSKLLKKASANALFGFMGLVYNGSITNVFAKFQLPSPKARDDTLVDNINGFILNTLMENDVNCAVYKRNFSEYIDSCLTIIKKTSTGEFEFPLDKILYGTNDSEAEYCGNILHQYATKICDIGLSEPVLTQLCMQKAIETNYSFNEFTLQAFYQKDPSVFQSYIYQLSKLYDAISYVGKNYGLCHNDAHLGNIMVERDTNRLVLIDFGRAFFDETLLGRTIDNDLLNLRISTEKAKHDYSIVCMPTELKTYEEYIKEPNKVNYNAVGLFNMRSVMTRDKLYLFDIMTISMNIVNVFHSVYMNIVRKLQKPTIQETKKEKYSAVQLGMFNTKLSSLCRIDYAILENPRVTPENRKTHIVKPMHIIHLLNSASLLKVLTNRPRNIEINLINTLGPGILVFSLFIEYLEPYWDQLGIKRYRNGCYYYYKLDMMSLKRNGIMHFAFQILTVVEPEYLYNINWMEKKNMGENPKKRTAENNAGPSEQKVPKATGGKKPQVSKVSDRYFKKFMGGMNTNETDSKTTTVDDYTVLKKYQLGSEQFEIPEYKPVSELEDIKPFNASKFKKQSNINTQSSEELKLNEMDLNNLLDLLPNESAQTKRNNTKTNPKKQNT
jgi:tRNA A-37 threonylcarbamoyl transferase component Bud32